MSERIGGDLVTRIRNARSLPGGAQTDQRASQSEDPSTERPRTAWIAWLGVAQAQAEKLPGKPAESRAGASQDSTLRFAWQTAKDEAGRSDRQVQEMDRERHPSFHPRQLRITEP